MVSSRRNLTIKTSTREVRCTCNHHHCRRTRTCSGTAISAALSKGTKHPLHWTSTTTLDFNHRDITENAFILATNLNSSLNRQLVNQALATPQRFTSLVPRLDFAINANHTLIVRYEDSRQDFDNIGAGGFRLAETAYNQKTAGHTLQVTETALLNPM